MNNNLVCGCKLINECAGLRLLRILFSLFRLFFLLPLTGDTDKLGWYVKTNNSSPTWTGTLPEKGTSIYIYLLQLQR